MTNLKDLRARVSDLIGDNPVVRASASLAGDSLVYLIGTLLIGVSNYILLPLYIEHLTAADFGVYSLLEVSVLIASTVSQAGLVSSYFKWFAELDADHRNDVLGTAMLIVIPASATMGAILWAIIASPMGMSWLETDSSAFAWTLMPLVAVEAMQAVLFVDLRARRRAMAYSLITLLRLVATVAATVWFVVAHDLGLYGVLMGRVIGGIVTVVAILPMLPLTSVRFGRATRYTGEMIRFGMPIVWAALAMLTLDAGGRYLISVFGTMEAVGTFTLGVKIANILAIVFLRPFGTAWSAFQYQIQHRDRAPQVYSKILSHSFVAGSLVAGFIILASPWLILMLSNESYLSLVPILPVLLIPNVVRPLEYWASTPLLISGKTIWNGISSSMAVVVMLGLGVLLIPGMPVAGAAVAWVAGTISGMIFLRAVGYRYYPIPFDTPRVAFGLAFWGAAALIRMALPLDTGFTGMGYTLAAAAGMGLVAVIAIYRRVRRTIV